MKASKRDSLRINFGDKDPIDRVLSETIRTVAQASGVGRPAAAKRLMTLGAFAYHGYDWRVMTDQMPKQKIVWVDIVWAFLRNESRSVTGNATTATSTKDKDADLECTPKYPTTDAPTTPDSQTSPTRDSETGSQPRARISSNLMY